MPKQSKKRIKNIGLKTLAVISLCIFILILCLIKFNITIPLDSKINSAYILPHSQLLNKIMFFIVDITSITNSIIIALIFLAFLLIIRRQREAIILVVSITSAFFLEFLTKILIHRLRPENALIKLTDYSFPSGHSTLSALIFTLMIYAFKDNIKNKILKYSFITFCILAFLAIGFSRIYIDVHWLSDVLGGFALGIFCFAIFASYLYEPRSKNEK